MNQNKLRQLINRIVKEEFAPAPQMGDIEPTLEDDEDRPLMDKRPDDGMDVSQHHKMMWAEALDFSDESSAEKLIDRVRMLLLYDLSERQIQKQLSKEFSNEEIYLAIKAAKILNKKSEEEHLKEISAISGGAAGLASSGKVSATSGGNAWKKQNPEHELMWSGDEPNDKRPKPGVKKKTKK